MDAFQALHDQERPRLLNPYVDQPDLVYAWEADDTLREVRLVPANAQATGFVQAAIADFGLDRSQLRRSRYLRFMIYRTLRRTLDDPGISAATGQELRQTVGEMANGGSPYAGIIRFFDNRAVHTL